MPSNNLIPRNCSHFFSSSFCFCIVEFDRRLIRAKSTSTVIGQPNRNVSVTNSPQRKRVEMHDTSNGSAKMTTTEMANGETNELRKPRTPIPSTAHEPNVAQQLIKNIQNVLSSPRQLREKIAVSLPTAETVKEIKRTASPIETTPTPKPTPTPTSAPNAETKIKTEETLLPVKQPTASVVVNEQVQNGEKVRLVFASNHYSGYVRSAASDAEFFDLLQRVAVSAQNAAKLTELPKRNEMVSAPFLGDYYRAIIVKAESIDLPIRVAFLDFGNIDAVKFDDLRALEDDLKNAKRFTFRIFFDGVDRETSNDEGLELLKQVELETKTSFSIYSSSNSPVIVKDSLVKLVNTKTKECLNDKLTPTKASKSSPAEPESPTPKTPPATVSPISPSKKVCQHRM